MNVIWTIAHSQAINLTIFIKKTPKYSKYNIPSATEVLIPTFKI